MKNKTRVANIIRWIARIWGSLSLVFLLFFVGAHVVSTITGNGDPIGSFRSTSELISFIFFPVSTIIGLATAWKWEGPGGLITILGIAGFHIMRPDLHFNYMIDGLAAPGLLYLIYWVLYRGPTNTKESN